MSNEITPWANWGDDSVYKQYRGNYVIMTVTKAHESLSDVWPFEGNDKPSFKEEFATMFKKKVHVNKNEYESSSTKMKSPYGKWMTVRGSDVHYIVCEKHADNSCK